MSEREKQETHGPRIELTSVHAVARQAEEVMLEENSDWFLTMQGHDFELHDAV